MNVFNLLFMLKLALKHWIALALAAIIAAGGAFVYFNYIVEPKYSATGSILVTNGAIISGGTFTSEDGKLSQADISTSLSFANTLTDILNTPGIYKELSNKIYNKYDHDRLKSMANVRRRADDSLFLDVTFISTDKDEAKNLTNLYLDLAPEYIDEYVPNTASAVTLADKATEVYLNTLTTVLIAAVGGAAVVYLIIFLIASSDSIIRDEDNFRERFDVPVIGVVPDFVNAKTKEGKYYKYNRYNSYYGYGYGYGYGGKKNAK